MRAGSIFPPFSSMPSLETKSNGSAIVRGFMARAFLPMNHRRLDTASMDVFGSKSVSYALEHGWLAAPGSDTTQSGELSTFTAGLQLTNHNNVSFDEPVTPTSVSIMAVLAVAVVGRSSLGIAVDFFAYPEDDDSKLELVGDYHVTFVNVSKQLRKPVPFSEEVVLHLEKLRSAWEEAAATHQGVKERSGVPRLDAATIITLSESCLASSVNGNISRSVLKGIVSSDADLLGSYHRKHQIRESDIDYNLHFNQHRLVQLVTDAFRGAVGDQRCILSKLLPKGQAYVMMDLLIRQIRIDYIKELPMELDGVDIHIFLSNLEDQQLILQNAEEHAFQKMVTVSFVCRGIPFMDSDENLYPAALGYLKVAV